VVRRGLQPKPYMESNYSLGWSYSKMYVFQRCQRQYYYDRINPRWITANREEIVKLRELSSIPISIGTAVHNNIGSYLRKCQADMEISEADFYASGAQILRDILNTEKIEEEVFLQEDGIEIKLREAFERTQTLLNTFWLLPDHQNITRSVCERADESFIDPCGEYEFYGEFRIDNFKGYGPPDLVYMSDEGKYELISWKTGTHNVDGFLMQLAGQLLCCIHSFEIEPELISGRVINLHRMDGQPVTLRGSSRVLDRCLQRMNCEIADLENMYEDPDYGMPKDLIEFSPAYSQTICTMCKYRGICEGPD